MRTNTLDLDQCLEPASKCEIVDNNNCVQIVRVESRRGKKTGVIHLKASPTYGDVNIKNGPWQTNIPIAKGQEAIRGYRVEPDYNGSSSKETLQIDIWYSNKRINTSDPETDVPADSSTNSLGTLVAEVTLRKSPKVP